MTTIQDIIKSLSNKDIEAYAGDSDETAVIVWNVETEKIKDALEGLHFKIIPNANYYGGTIIIPKK
jgi:hypothetical protein